MPSLRERRPKSTIRDFIEADHQVVALEGFRPMPIGHEVERGRFDRLSDELVRQYPAYFAVLVPVSQVIGEIER
jgi:hypothetical protein